MEKALWGSPAKPSEAVSLGAQGASSTCPAPTEAKPRRKSGVMSEFCLQRRAEGYEARSGDKQDKGRWSLKRPPALNSAPQSGSGLFVRWLYLAQFAVQGGRS